MESGRRNGVPGVGGDPCVPNEKSPKIDLCSLVEGLPVRPLAIRCGVCAGQLPFDTPRGQGAPSTIRCIETPSASRTHESTRNGQGAPSTIRCIETCAGLRFDRSSLPRQGAPSTIRCIETGDSEHSCVSFRCGVREHPAPSGALRRIGTLVTVDRTVPSGSTQHHQVH